MVIGTAVFFTPLPISDTLLGGKIFEVNLVFMTKRQLGLTFIVLGGLGIVGLFGIDLIGAGQFSGIGPAQRLGLLAAGAVILVGLTLLPLGDKPA